MTILSSKPTSAFERWILRVRKKHEGRYALRLAVYAIVLLVLTPISLALYLINTCASAVEEWSETLNDRLTVLYEPIEKWAESRKTDT